MEHRDAAANCSSDDEDVAAALAESGDGGDSEISGEDSDRRVEAWEHGYMVDGFLVRDESEDEVWYPSTADRVLHEHGRDVVGSSIV